MLFKSYIYLVRERENLLKSFHVYSGFNCEKKKKTVDFIDSIGRGIFLVKLFSFYCTACLEITGVL